MPFDPTAYGSEIASVLAISGAMPLVASVIPTADQRRAVSACAFAGPTALAGLWTGLSCFDEAHKIAQQLHSAEGSYWHAILHRREPDAGNSGYWFRKAGVHPIFAGLRLEAEKLGYTPGPKWDPLAFIDYCEQARERPGSSQAQIACAVTLAEWQLLFDYCARRMDKTVIVS